MMGKGTQRIHVWTESQKSQSVRLKEGRSLSQIPKPHGISKFPNTAPPSLVIQNVYMGIKSITCHVVPSLTYHFYGHP